ncbi:cupin domain-containing protein [Subtercola boreus]|uniref:Cupin n=1 Tax=Subtercola boreus TaxID=120213 RepID=A0A3E0W835_9MICO|nr:cupin domain-containing protein [Subtercola boreus]RFA19292.1 cupin [Subtercola boreus]RFA19552.1 cupin [Subtercola boreus]RFA25918.1 cupin [Subtercola boreus]
MDALPALTRMVGDLAPTFGADYWSTKPYVYESRGDAQRFDDLFSADAVDELVTSRGIRTPFMRMATEGTVLAQKSYTAPGGFGAEVGDQVSSEKVLAEFAGGATIVLQGLHRTWPPLVEFTRRLTDDLGHPAQVNAYITPASSRGFDPHYDVHDVFVLQISGEKQWRIHRPVHVDPLRDQPWSDHRAAVAAEASGAAHIDRVLQPGDVLYLPRGWIHSAEALGGTSVHLTIGIAAYTRADVASTLLEVIGKTPALRGSLPLGIDFSDPAEVQPIVEQVLESLRAALAVPDDRSTAARQVQSVGAALARRLATDVKPEPVSPLATVDAIAALSATSRVRWRGSLRARVEDAGETVRILAGTKVLALPAEAASAVRALAGGAPTAVGALPGLDTDSAIVVVRRLLREGLVVPA